MSHCWTYVVATWPMMMKDGASVILTPACYSYRQTIQQHAPQLIQGTTVLEQIKVAETIHCRRRRRRTRGKRKLEQVDGQDDGESQLC